MELQKIYTDSDFSSAVVPDGQLLLFNALEDGKPVTRYKDSNGNFGKLSGSGSSTVILGQVNADGNFQALAFSGTEASNSGDPEAVEEYYTFNGVLSVPDSGIHIGGSADYYKCASVDTVNKTWTGYKAVLTDGVYTFEDIATEGLNYGDGYTPKVYEIYNSIATVKVSGLWTGAKLAEGLVFDLPMDTYITTAPSGQALSIDSSVTQAEFLGKKGYYFWDSSGITFPADALSTDDYTIAISMARTHTDSGYLQTAIGYGKRGSTGSTALIGVINGETMFFGGYASDYTANTTQAQDHWYHSAVTKKGSELTIYQNGVPVAPAFFNDALIQGVGYIGRNSENNERWHGYLADAKIWNRALSAEEISILFESIALPE